MKTYFIYIWFKVLINKIIGNISPLSRELIFVNGFVNVTMGILKDRGIIYKADLLNGKQWDWQFSADKVAGRGGADCNSIMRIYQAFWYLKGWNAYLVTIIADDPAKCHATCIIEKNKEYFLVDYDDKIQCDSYCDCINTVQKKYNIHKITDLVSQDINWKVVKI